VFKANLAIFQLFHGENKLIIYENNDEARFVVDQHVFFYRSSSLTQQSADRHVVQLGHIILIPSQSVFAVSSQCCVLSRKATNTNFIDFGVTRSGLESTIYRI